MNTSHAFPQGPLDTGQMSAGHPAQQTGWSWPQIDQPVDVNSFMLREWTHDGDSLIIAARPRKPRGAPVPPPAYLLKVGRDAIGERLYSLAARHFHLPSAVVFWTTSSDLPEAAIRFEPDAWRPARIDPEQGIATSAGRAASLQNPPDYYRHLALSAFLGDYDGPEFLVSQGVLFRVDAAAIGWHLFDLFLPQVFSPEERNVEKDPARLSTLMQVTTEGVQAEASPGTQVYLDMVAEMVAWAELPTVLAHDLRTCPAAACQFIPPGVRAMLAQEIPTLADVVEASLRQHQKALKQVLT